MSPICRSGDAGTSAILLGAIPVSPRIVEQLAYGKDLKGGAVPGIAQVPGIIAFAGGLSTQSARPNPAFPLHLESSQASNAKCLTS
jgi:hypothetical protein